MFDCFKSKKTNYGKFNDEDWDELGNTGRELSRDFRVAEVIGHTDSSSGAATYSIPGVGPVREYDWNKDRHIETKSLVDLETTDIAMKGFYRDGIGRSGVADQLYKWKPDIIHERHFNSIGDRLAFGFEILMLESSKGKEAESIGRLFCESFQEGFGTKPRHDKGIKWLKKGDRGFKNLHYYASLNHQAKCIFLSEPFFAGCKSKESEIFLENDGHLRWSIFMADFYQLVKIKFFD